MLKIATARTFANRLNVGDTVVRWHYLPSGRMNGHAVVRSRRDYPDGSVSVTFEGGDVLIYPAGAEVMIEFDL